MKSSAIAVLGAVAIGALGGTSAAQAAMINFAVAALDGTVLYTGPSLNLSSAFDFDTAILLVSETGAGDASGLNHFDTVKVSPTDIMYGSGSAPTDLPGGGIVKTWTGHTGDSFTETLTHVDKINRGTPNAITVTLSGTLSDTDHIFVDAPAFFILSANQVGGSGSSISATFTDTSKIGGVPEPSTWAMMALGFGALGYAASRRRKSNVAMLSA
jgi:hypothetical protein